MRLNDAYFQVNQSYLLGSVGDAVDFDDASEELALPLYTGAAVHLGVPEGEAPDVEAVSAPGHQGDVHDVLEVAVGRGQSVHKLLRDSFDVVFGP